MNESQFDQKIKQERKPSHQRGRILYPPIPIQPSPINGIPNILRKRRFGLRQVHLSRRRTFRSSSPQPSSSRVPSIRYLVDDAIDKVGHRAHHSDSSDDLTGDVAVIAVGVVDLKSTGDYSCLGCVLLVFRTCARQSLIQNTTCEKSPNLLGWH
jgi:hypothetical protein